MVGKTLVVTDGTTVLGADDKAGVAEIMTMAERLLAEKIPHGPLALCFCPGRGDRPRRGAAGSGKIRRGLAYTVDGGAPGEIEYENFNAAAAKVTFHGFNVHPGSAKDTMVNASLLAMEFNAMLPDGDTPRDTEGYEGFFHLTEMQGSVEKATLHYIIRDHDAGAFEPASRPCWHIATLLNAKYGAGTVELTVTEQYRNMAERSCAAFEVVEKAKAAVRRCGLEPEASPSAAAPTALRCPSEACPARICPPPATATTAPMSTPWPRTWSGWWTGVSPSWRNLRSKQKA